MGSPIASWRQYTARRDARMQARELVLLGLLHGRSAIRPVARDRSASTLWRRREHTGAAVNGLLLINK
jgi:hypothetical protein